MSRRNSPLIFLAAFLACVLLACDASVSFAQTPRDFDANREKQLEFFESRIRPVLIEHCYACHNSSDSKEGELALDDRRGTRSGGSGGKIILPGDPNGSRLIAILKHEIEGLEMPEDGPKLDAKIIANFEKWIQTGALDPRDQPPSMDELADSTSWATTKQRRLQWWSWQPIREVSPPPGSGSAIDRLVRAKLEEHGLQPSHAATSEVLIRRLYLTLIGMPPTNDELDGWMKRLGDSSTPNQQATDELIDHLLGSDHFGERWARHWMDWIRYAESHGSEGDPAIVNAWMYRDYLIRALNDDVGYDTLVREHIAGDLLKIPRINETLGINESAIGPAHWRMVFHGFAPTDALDEKVRFVDDQVDVFSKAFLGLTVSCARCHDHKFDAISQRDYYALFGILASCRPARRVIDTPDRQRDHASQLRELKPQIRSAVCSDWRKAEEDTRRRIGNLFDEDTQNGTSLAKELSRIGSSSRSDSHVIWNQWTEASLQTDGKPNDATSQNWTFGNQGDHSGWHLEEFGLSSGPVAPGEFTVALAGPNAIESILPSGLYSHLLTSKHAARLTSPDFSVSEDQAVWVHAKGNKSTFRYVIQDYPRNGTVYPVTQLKPEWKWHRLDLSYWRGDSAHLEIVTAQDAPLLAKNDPGSWFGIREARITHKNAPAPKVFNRFLSELVAGSETPPQTPDQWEATVWAAIERSLNAWEEGTCNDAQADLLDQALRSGLLKNKLSSLSSSKQLITRYRKLEESIAIPTRVPGLDETRSRVQPLFVRGNHKQPTDEVPQRFLEAIDETPYETDRSGRLQLAEDLLRNDNPLPRRVLVNRVWHHLFGRGIVETPDNFGRLGQPPTHPELLDWLATQFERDGWSLKSLIRSIVRTKTWQQSSRPSKKAENVDPNNRWLSHANVRRLDAEAIRDSLLVASGELERKAYGPPVGGNAPRRSVYVSVIRNRLDPFLRAFDFPEPSSTTGRRDITNVPAQSLTMMNDPRVASQAIKLATSIHQSNASEDESLQRLYTRLFSRSPTNREAAIARQFLKESQDAAEQTIQSAEGLRQQHADLLDKRRSLMEPARTKLLADRPKQSTASLRPLAKWTFDSNTKDQIGSLHGIIHGPAQVKDGSLHLKSGAYVTTPPIPKPITEKTLEVWVSVDDLQQRGGGVLTIQTPNGVVFDSIVYAERDSRQWLAGSNVFARTEPFGGEPENAQEGEPIHVAIVYSADGTITGYRNGKPYGKSYRKGTPVTYQADDAILSFGVRHLPAGGNRLFRGRIDSASLYDRALSVEEIAASFVGSENWVSDADVIRSLSVKETNRLKTLEQQANDVQQQLKELGPVPSRFGDREAWIELTRTLLTLKEFIYVR